MEQQEILIAVALVAIPALVIANMIRSRARRRVVAEKLEAGAKIVDVRTAAEFGSGHYPGAISVPLDKLEKRIKSLGSRDSSIIVYCASGSRSRVARSRLRAAGFTDVINGGALSGLPQ